MALVIEAAQRGAVAFRARLSADTVAILTLLALTGAFAWERLHSARGIARLDTITFFLPMYTELGERLRAGDIPGWNPHQLAGAPFAGDPESGWMYFPAMLLFTALPPVAAFTALVTVHLALGGLATYALARTLGMGVLPSMVSATAFAFGAFSEFTGCCTIYAQLTAWLPVSLLGVELAIRSASPLSRSGWWCLSGLAISQMLAGWFGQGAYYGLLTVGGFVLFRTVLAPPATASGWTARLSNLLIHGAVILALGFGLAAAGILPRLDALGRSTLAGGDYRAFAPYVAQPDDWTLPQVINQLLSIDADRLRYYAGGAVLMLALFALPLAGRRYAAPFFAAVSLIVLVLASEPTPLHRLFFVLPRFALIHDHYSFRVLIIFYLATSLLAGATVAALPALRHRRWPLFICTPIPLLLLLVATPPPLFANAGAISPATIVAMAVVALLLALYAITRPDWLRRLVPPLLLLAILVDPTGWLLIADREMSARLNLHGERLIGDYNDQGGPAAFLRQQQDAAPLRFFGYEQAIATRRRDPQVFNGQFRHPDIFALVLNNRAHAVGLQDIQGYNPVQIARFTTYVTAMNAEPQEYHEAHVLPGAFDSPLLDALNLRYLIVADEVPPGRPDLLHIGQRFPTVYADRRVRILENPDAFPRAWLVHDAHQVPPQQALPLVASGRVDLARTVVLESEPPALALPAEPAADNVRVHQSSPDGMTLTTRTDAPGMVVLSEVYDPNWNAYVDGEAVPLVVANHALRAVAVPAGEHTLELRYESRSLQLGLLISGLTALVMLGTWAAVGAHTLRRTLGHVE